MKIKRPKITTILVVFALIIYGGALIISIQNATVERERENNRLALEVAELEIEVAELEFAIARYMEYEAARAILEAAITSLSSIDDTIARLEDAIANQGMYEMVDPESGEFSLLQRDIAELEEEKAQALLERTGLQAELEIATRNFNDVDISDVIAEIARVHLGLERPEEIILHETGN